MKPVMKTMIVVSLWAIFGCGEATPNGNDGSTGGARSSYDDEKRSQDNGSDTSSNNDAVTDSSVSDTISENQTQALEIEIYNFAEKHINSLTNTQIGILCDWYASQVEGGYNGYKCPNGVPYSPPSHGQDACIEWVKTQNAACEAAVWYWLDCAKKLLFANHCVQDAVLDAEKTAACQDFFYYGLTNTYYGPSCYPLK